MTTSDELNCWELFGETTEEKEIERVKQWLAVRKEAALHIDPATAEVVWEYGQTFDPYLVRYLPPDYRPLHARYDQVERCFFARSPGSDVWVSFDDLPDATRDALRDEHQRKLYITAYPGEGVDMNWGSRAQEQVQYLGAPVFEYDNDEDSLEV
jgi:hypothetical protein